MALCHTITGGSEESVLKYDKLALNEPLSDDDYFEATFGLACTSRGHGKFNDAERALETLVRDFPGKQKPFCFFTLCSMSSGKKDLHITPSQHVCSGSPPADAVSDCSSALTVLP